jgi:hypothetical protein
VFHALDPERRKTAKAAREKGVRNSARKKDKNARRTVLASELPIEGPPQTLDDAAVLSAWVAIATATGQLDPSTSRAIMKSLEIFKAVLKERDYVQEIARLKELVRTLKEKRGEPTPP